MLIHRIKKKHTFRPCWGVHIGHSGFMWISSIVISRTFLVLGGCGVTFVFAKVHEGHHWSVQIQKAHVHKPSPNEVITWYRWKWCQVRCKFQCNSYSPNPLRQTCNRSSGAKDASPAATWWPSTLRWSCQILPMFCCYDWVKVPFLMTLSLRPLQIPWPTHENHRAQEKLQEPPEHSKLWLRAWFFFSAYWSATCSRCKTKTLLTSKSPYPCQATISNLASNSSLRPRILNPDICKNHHFSNLKACTKRESYGGQRHWFLASLWKSNSSSTAPSHSVTLCSIGIEHVVSNLQTRRFWHVPTIGIYSK